MRVPLPFAVAVLVVALACGCASPSPSEATGDETKFELAPGDQVEAIYQDRGIALALRNRGWTTADDSSRNATDLHLKVAADEDVARLLKGLELLDYFEVATPQPQPRARATLTVTRNGRTWVANGLGSEEDLQRFNRFVAAFRTVYDSTFYSMSGVGSGGVDPAPMPQRDASARSPERR